MVQKKRLAHVLGFSELVASILFWILMSPSCVNAKDEDSSAVPHPNIILILVDDLGWADPGFHGGDARLTPNIDQLAQQGMQLSQF